MNTPEIYLVEPYNAYAPKGRKKHWHEIIEEQALIQRILAEQIALREAASKTLPQQAPTIFFSKQLWVSLPGASFTGAQGSGAGSGGSPFPQFFHPSMNLTGSRNPSSGSAPTAVQFGISGDTNLISLNAVSIKWNFGDGTIVGGVESFSYLH